MERDDFIPIPDLEQYYINRCGKVINKRTGNFVPTRIINGYTVVSLTVNKKAKPYAVHRLVALTYISNPRRCGIVNHKNGNKLDNHVDNLEWMTQQENVHHSLQYKNISHPRPVLQLKEGIVISRYDTVTHAGVSVGLSRYAISKACLNINKTAGGFQWKYQDDEYSHKIVDVSSATKIYDYDNYYIFSDGKVYNSMRKSFLKPVKNDSGYCYVTLCKNRQKKNYYVHRLVAEHFLHYEGNLVIERKGSDSHILIFIIPMNEYQVDHLNKKRDDNNITNLEWVTASENISRIRSSVPNR